MYSCLYTSLCFCEKLIGENQSAIVCRLLFDSRRHRLISVGKPSHRIEMEPTNYKLLSDLGSSIVIAQRVGLYTWDRHRSCKALLQHRLGRDSFKFSFSKRLCKAASLLVPRTISEKLGTKGYRAADCGYSVTKFTHVYDNRSCVIKPEEHSLMLLL